MAKKNKKTSEQNTSETSQTDFFSRLLKPFKILVEIHLKLALRELKKDTQRFFSGILSFILGCFFFIVFYLLINALAVILLHEILELMFCILIVAGFNLLLTLILIASGKSKFKKPFLGDTKKVIEDTLDEMKD